MATNRHRVGSVMYISHGGGPLPLLGDPGHARLRQNLEELAASVARPSAIVVFSAHWEEKRPTVTAAATPDLIYDYYGFPDESYSIQYPAPGAPGLARHIVDMLEGQSMGAVIDPQRGFDHGLFVPLKIMYPEADIPCLQVSLLESLSPAQHIGLGRALSGLLDANVLLIGSGFSFHNMKAFFAPGSDEFTEGNLSFDRWLRETCTSETLDEAHREKRLLNWHQAPAARMCHPREEHLLPLHVCYGLAGSAARQAFTFNIMGMQASAFVW